MSLPHDTTEVQLSKARSDRLYRMQFATMFAVVAMLGLNAYLLFLSTDTVVMYVDLARLAESDHFDALDNRLDRVEDRIDEHARQLGLATLEEPYGDSIASLE